MTSIEELQAQVILLEEQVVGLRVELGVAVNDLDEIIASITKVLDSTAFKSDINSLLQTLQRLGEFNGVDLSLVML